MTEYIVRAGNAESGEQTTPSGLRLVLLLLCSVLPTSHDVNAQQYKQRRTLAAKKKKKRKKKKREGVKESQCIKYATAATMPSTKKKWKKKKACVMHTHKHTHTCQRKRV